MARSLSPGRFFTSTEDKLRATEIQYHFERQQSLAGAIQSLNLERIRMMAQGDYTHSEFDRIEETLKRLEVEKGTYAASTKRLQQQQSEAAYYIQLLSAGTNEKAAADGAGADEKASVSK